MSNRVEYVDVAKGIGIVLVVLGHNQIKAALPALTSFIYSFHMPLFFLLSGMFFRPTIRFVDLLKRRFHTILQPYLVIILLMYAVAFLFTEIDLSIILSRLAKAAYASGYWLDWAQLWFLPALFAVNIFVWLFFKLIYGHLPALWMRVLLLLGMLWLGVATLKFFLDYQLMLPGGRSFALPGLPFSLDLLLVLAAFFLMGYEIYQAVPEKFYASWVVLLVSGILLVALNIIFPFKIDFFSRTYESFPINSLEALAGSLFILCLSKQIALRGGWLSQALQYLGRVSLILLIFHGPIQIYSYEKLNDWLPNPYVIGLISFVLALGIPLIIYEWMIRPNPVVATWFGMERKKTDEQTH